MAQLGTIRRVLDEFCIARSVSIDSPLAIDAANHLVTLRGRELDLRQLRAELDSWSRGRSPAQA